MFTEINLIFWLLISSICLAITTSIATNICPIGIGFSISSLLCLCFHKIMPISIQIIFIVIIGTFLEVFFLHYFVNKTKPTYSDELDIINEVGIVTEPIDTIEGTGYIKVNGQSWKAKSEIFIDKNQKVVIKKIEGVSLIVEPLINNDELNTNKIEREEK